VPAPASPEVPEGKPGPRDWDEMVVVGRVARPHGLRGEVIVNSSTDFPDERFRAGATVVARPRGGEPEVVEITAVKFHSGRPILRMAGFESIEDAERLAGAELRVPADDLGTLPEGVYYHHQLVGCEVVTDAGDSVGRVTAVEGDGGASRLVVRGRRGEVLIPLAREICSVDVGAQRIVVTPPDGLLELNGDWR
jgi:16S rRNA processing protein RimM